MMRKRKTKFLFLFIQMVMVSGFLFSLSDYKMEKDLTVPENTVYPHNIVSLKGSLDIKGSMKESIFLVGGQLTLDGVVEKDVICIASQVKIGKNALIKRDFFIIGGTLERDTGARVEGEFVYFKFDLQKIENTIIPILSDSRTISLIKTVKIILWFIIALILFAVVPQKINSAEEIFDKHRLKIGAIGFLSLFFFIFLLFIFIILSFVIIGIPLLIISILFYFVTFTFGRTVMFYYIGLKLSHFIKFRNITPAIFIMIGAIIYALLKFLPVLGSIVLIVLNIFELGIGVSYFLRKKLKFG
jgi:hypothetical protein